MAQIIYSTIGSQQEARTIAATLVRERLAACVNLIPKVESIYRWKDKVEGAQETILIAKTQDDKAQAAITRIRSLHSYELPDIILLPIIGGLPEYLEYLTEEST
jgi:periplasmic divalent cation tolerance protein